MRQESLAFPYHGQCPGNLRLYKGNVNEFFVIQALTDRVRQECNAQLGAYDFGLEIPVAALADNPGMGHDFLIKCLDERIERE